MYYLEPAKAGWAGPTRKRHGVALFQYCNHAEIRNITIVFQRSKFSCNLLMNKSGELSNRELVIIERYIKRLVCIYSNSEDQLQIIVHYFHSSRHQVLAISSFTFRLIYKPQSRSTTRSCFKIKCIPSHCASVAFKFKVYVINFVSVVKMIYY